MKEIHEIVSKDDMWLTQATTLEDDANRIFVKRIAGFNVKAEDWRDATDAEKEQWEREHANPEIPEIGGGGIFDGSAR